jgi:excisionase family DNA binding protein
VPLSRPLGEEIELPASIFYVLRRIADVMAHGNAITVVPVGQKLSTQQAANILMVSRQYLVRLLERGRIPYEKAGTHRRLSIQDVLAFKRERAVERRKGPRRPSGPQRRSRRLFGVAPRWRRTPNTRRSGFALNQLASAAPSASARPSEGCRPVRSILRLMQHFN